MGHTAVHSLADIKVILNTIMGSSYERNTEIFSRLYDCLLLESEDLRVPALTHILSHFSFVPPSGTTIQGRAYTKKDIQKLGKKFFRQINFEFEGWIKVNPSEEELALHVWNYMEVLDNQFQKDIALMQFLCHPYVPYRQIPEFLIEDVRLTEDIFQKDFTEVYLLLRSLVVRLDVDDVSCQKFWYTILSRDSAGEQLVMFTKFVRLLVEQISYQHNLYMVAQGKPPKNGKSTIEKNKGLSDETDSAGGVGSPG